MKSGPRVCEQSSIMAEIASETESYLSKNETESVLFLLLQQSHINEKM